MSLQHVIPGERRKRRDPCGRALRADALDPFEIPRLVLHERNDDVRLRGQDPVELVWTARDRDDGDPAVPAVRREVPHGFRGFERPPRGFLEHEHRIGQVVKHRKRLVPRVPVAAVVPVGDAKWFRGAAFVQVLAQRRRILDHDALVFAVHVNGQRPAPSLPELAEHRPRQVAFPRALPADDRRYRGFFESVHAPPFRAPAC